jgi:hypothetical protein
MATTLVRFQPRRKTAAAWTSSNELLLQGEPGFETDTGRSKVGDGTTTWAGLPYDPHPSTVAGLYTPEMFGAVADGNTDDGPALTAAYTAASTAAGSAGRSTIRLTPGKKYRVATSVTVAQNVTLDGRGAVIGGGITGAGLIGSTAPATPAASDVTGQTAGAAFTDDGGTGTIGGLRFVGLRLQGFRYGFLSKCYAWPYAIWEDVTFENCNIGIFAYQGAQEVKLLNTRSVGGAASTTFVAAATAFPTGHPYAGRDNYFCDGLVYDQAGDGRDSSHTNTVFDTWFAAAILRPTTPSVTVGNPGGYVYPQTDDSTAVTGRNIYVPQRNNRLSFSPQIRRASSEATPLGVALIGNPSLADIRNITGEGLFAAGPKSMIVFVVNNGATDALLGTVQNVDGIYNTNPSLYGVEVRSTTLTRAGLDLVNVSGNQGPISNPNFARRSGADIVVDPAGYRDGGFGTATTGWYTGYRGATGVRPIIVGGKLTRTEGSDAGGNKTLYMSFQTVGGKVQHVRFKVEFPDSNNCDTIALVWSQVPNFPSLPQPPGQYAGIHMLFSPGNPTSGDLGRIATGSYGLPAGANFGAQSADVSPLWRNTTRIVDVHVDQTRGWVRVFVDGTKYIDVIDPGMLPYIGDSVTLEWFGVNTIAPKVLYFSASKNLDPVGNLTAPPPADPVIPQVRGYVLSDVTFTGTGALPTTATQFITGSDVFVDAANGNIKVGRAGTYIVSAEALLKATGGAGLRTFNVLVNGTAVRNVKQNISDDWGAHICFTRTFAANDIVTINAVSAVSTTVNTGSQTNTGITLTKIV